MVARKKTTEELNNMKKTVLVNYIKSRGLQKIHKTELKGYYKIPAKEIDKLRNIVISIEYPNANSPKANSPKAKANSPKAKANSPKAKKRTKTPKAKKRTKVKKAANYDQYKNVVYKKKKLRDYKVAELKKIAKDMNLKSSGMGKSHVIVMIGIKLNSIKNQSKSPKKDNNIFPDEDIYANKDRAELLNLLKDFGVTKGIENLKKNELVEYLKSERCDPLDEKYCSDDNVCDIRNNICLPPNLVKNNLSKLILENGNEIVGSKEDIEKLKQELGIKKVENKEQIDLDDGDNQDDIEQLMGKLDINDKEQVDLDDEHKKQDDIEQLMGNLDINDKEQVYLDETNIDDIINDLNDIEESDNEIDDLNDIHQNLLDCLGLN